MYLKNTELKGAFDELIRNNKLTEELLSNFIEINIGIELNRKIIPCDGVTFGGLCCNQFPQELAKLLMFLYYRRDEIFTYMEIGVNKGGTFYTIDSWLRAINSKFLGSTAIDIKSNMRDLEDYLSSYPTVTFKKINSKELKVTEKIDFCLIDGDHSYEGVKSDFLNVREYAKFIAFHDISILHKQTNVKKLWDEIHNNFISNEFKNKDNRFKNEIGIGVIKT